MRREGKESGMLLIGSNWHDRRNRMNRRTNAWEREMITSLLSEEMYQTGMIYCVYPEGYNQGVADNNNRLYADFLRRQFRTVTPEVGHILVNSWLAQTMLRAYYYAISELVCRQGSRVDVKDTYLIIRGLVKMWRQVFWRMDPGLIGNEDLAEIMRNIQLDGNEGSNFESVQA